jgi:hypothetical protein
MIASTVVISLTDAIEAYEAFRWPDRKIPGCND